MEITTLQGGQEVGTEHEQGRANPDMETGMAATKSHIVIYAGVAGHLIVCKIHISIMASPGASYAS